MEEISRDPFSDEDLDELTRRAEAGDPDAMHSLAYRANYQGPTAEYWYRRAMMTYEEQARQGDVFAMMHLGEQYSRNYFGMRDVYRACCFYARAAEAGEMEALTWLGKLYSEEGSPVYDEGRAWHCLQRAVAHWLPKAQAGDLDAVYRVGWLYMCMDPRLHPEATEEALRWLSWAAESGDETACSDIGRIYWDKRRPIRDVETSVRWHLNKRTMLEWILSEVELRTMYKEDPEPLLQCGLFMTWLHQLAEVGNPFAEAVLYGEDGDGEVS